MPIQSTDLYVRICQECGHKQESKPCAEYKSDSWRDTLCKKCHSSGLDYGSFGWDRLSDGSFAKPKGDDDSNDDE